MTLREAGLLRSTILQAVYISIHNLPYLNFVVGATQSGYSFNYTYSSVTRSNFIFTIITTLRCVFMINLIVVFSAFNEMVMKLACDKYKINFSYELTIKSLLMSIPYTVTGTLLLGFLFVFSYTLQKFELPYRFVSGQKWEFLLNGFWNAVITMTTVGYGDLFAVTFFGRVTAIVIMFWGAFINSLIIMSMTISSRFTAQEENVRPSD